MKNTVKVTCDAWKVSEVSVHILARMFQLVWCDVSCLKAAGWICSCLSVTAGWTTLILPFFSFFLVVINLSLSLSQSLKHMWANKIQLYSVPKKQLSVLMLHTNTVCLFYLCVNPFSVWQGIWRQAMSKLQIRAGHTDISCSDIYRRGDMLLQPWHCTLHVNAVCLVHSLLFILPVIYCVHSPTDFQAGVQL